MCMFIDEILYLLDPSSLSIFTSTLCVDRYVPFSPPTYCTWVAIVEVMEV